MILVDTNIFLEILLEQEAKEKCKEYLNANVQNICLTDFALHSIGLLLFKKGKKHIFTSFADDILGKIPIISLSEKNYSELEHISLKHHLDFDDSYQFCVSKENDFEIT